MLRSSAAIAVVVGGIWSFGGCGEDSDPVRVPEAHADPRHAVPCPRQVHGKDSAEWLPSPASFDARILIRMSERDAVQLALEHGCTLRVAVRDGEGQYLTGDEQPDRVDVYVDDGRIVGVRPG